MNQVSKFDKWLISMFKKSASQVLPAYLQINFQLLIDVLMAESFTAVFMLLNWFIATSLLYANYYL